MLTSITYIAIFLLVHYFPLLLALETYYITNEDKQDDGDGSYNDPFKNIEVALDQSQLKSQSSSIYLILMESSSTVYTYSGTQKNYVFHSSLEITSETTMNNIYFSTDYFTLQFDNSNQVSQINLKLSNLNFSGPSAEDSLYDESDPQIMTLFNLKDVSNLTLENVYFKSIYFKSNFSAIIMGTNLMDYIIMDYVFVEDYFSTNGFLFCMQYDQSNNFEHASTKIKITNSEFQNFNTENNLISYKNDSSIQAVTHYDSKGYVLCIQGGVLSVFLDNVYIHNMNNHLVDGCTDEIFGLPLNSESFNASRILSFEQFYFDHLNKATASAIFIDHVKNGFEIYNSDFININGLSGSVITVNNLTASNGEQIQAYVNIESSNFIGNFAFKGFPVIRIHQQIYENIVRPNNDNNNQNEQPSGRILEEDNTNLKLDNRNLQNQEVLAENTNIFGNFFKCSQIYFFNISVQNNYGCPFGGGVIWVGCLANPHIFYDAEVGVIYDETLDIVGSPAVSDLENIETILSGYANDDSLNKKMTLRNSTFIGNRMSLSSGLVINGFQSLNLVNNTFKENGVLFDKNILDYMVNNQDGFFNTWGYVPLSQNSLDMIDYALFTHTSPLLIGYALYMEIKNNIFDNNWQLFQYDQNFGSQMTLNCFLPLIEKSVQFEKNIFQNNAGVPKELLLDMIDFETVDPISTALITIMAPDSLPVWMDTYEKFLKSNYLKYTFPYLTAEERYFAIDQYDFDQTYSYPTQINKFILNETYFINNKFSFNYADQTYCNYESTIKDNLELLTDHSPAKSGIFYIFRYPEIAKNLDKDVSTDKYSAIVQRWLSIVDCKFIKNTFLTEGCLLSSFAFNIEILDSIFSDNSLYNPQPQKWDYKLYLNTVYSRIIKEYDYGLVCMLASSYFVSRIQFVEKEFTGFISNTSFFRNNGTILNLYDQAKYSLNISNSSFTNNIEEANSLIIGHEQNLGIEITFTNFTNNRGYFGLISFFEIYDVLFNYNRYINNTGFWAAVIYMEANPDIAESANEHKLRYNNDETSLIMDDITTPKETNSIYDGNYNIFDTIDIQLSLKITPYGGGIITQNGLTLLIQDTNFTNNSPLAGIILGYGCVAHFSNCYFIDNVVDDGVLLALMYSFSTLIFENCTIQNNVYLFNENPKFNDRSVIASNMGLLVVKNLKIYNNSIGISEFFKVMSSGLFIRNVDINYMISTQEYPLEFLISAFNSNLDLKEIVVSESPITFLTAKAGTLSADNINFTQVSSINNGTNLIKSSLFSFVEIASSNLTNIIVEETESNIKSPFNFLTSQNLNNILIKNFQLLNIFTTTDVLSFSGISELNLKNINVSNFKADLSSLAVFKNVKLLNLNQIFLSNIVTSKREILSFESVNNINIINAHILGAMISVFKIYVSSSVLLQDIIIEDGFSKFNLALFSRESYFKCSTSSSDAAYYTIILEQVNNFSSKNVTIQDSCTGMMLNEVQQAEILKTDILNSMSLTGSALFIQCLQYNSQINIKKSYFANNMAKSVSGTLNGGYGGAIYYNTLGTMATSCNLNIEDSTFKNNSASTSGGSIYWNYFPVMLEEGVVFDNNTAIYGKDVASYEVELIKYDIDYPPFIDYYNWFNPYDEERFLSEEEQENLYKDIINCVSGAGVQDNLYYAIIDVYGQVVNKYASEEMPLWVRFRDEENENFKPSSQYISPISGIFNVSNFKITFEPGLDAHISFVFNSLRSLPPPYNNSFPIVKMKNATLSFRECELGEIYLEDNTCSRCGQGTYSFTYGKDAKICYECPDNSTCPGGSIVLPHPGYWRLNTNSSNVLPCINSEACTGGNSNNTLGECNSTYKGNLCSSCEEGYVATSENVCVNCQTDWLYYLKIVGLGIFQLLLISWSIRSTLSSLSKKINKANAIEEPNNNQNSWFELDNEEIQSTITKMFMNFAQVSGLLMRGSTSIFGFVNSFFVNLDKVKFTTSTLQVDCLYYAIFGNAIEIFYQKSIFSFIQPFLYILLAVIFWSIYIFVRVKKGERKTNFIRKLFCSIVIILFNTQPSLIDAGFGFFKCVNLGSGDEPKYYLDRYYDISCDDTKSNLWKFGFGLPFIIFWGLAVPGFLFFILYRNRKNLGTPDLLSKYSFIYECYNTKYFYWEFVIMFRKYGLLVIAIVLFKFGDNIIAAFNMSVIAIALILQIKFHPYNSSRLNKLEIIGLIFNMIFAYSVVLNLINGEKSMIVAVGIVIFTLISAIIFLSHMILYFLREVLKGLMKNKFIGKILIKIIPKFLLKKIFPPKASNKQMELNSLSPSNLIFPHDKPLESAKLTERNLAKDELFNNSSLDKTKTTSNKDLIKQNYITDEISSPDLDINSSSAIIQEQKPENQAENNPFNSSASTFVGQSDAAQFKSKKAIRVNWGSPSD